MNTLFRLGIALLIAIGSLTSLHIVSPMLATNTVNELAATALNGESHDFIASG